MRRLLHFVAGLAGIMSLLAIVEYLPAPRYTYLWDRTFDTGHILIFGIGVMMSLTMVRAFFKDQAIRMQYWVAIVFTLLLGLAVEVWQSQHNRTAEWIDVYSDLAGILAFAAIYAMLDQRIVSPRTGWLKRSRLTLIAGVILFAGLVPYLQTLNLYRVRSRILPSLIDFEQPWYPFFYYERSAIFSVVDPPEGWPESAQRFDKVAKIQLTSKKRFPGFTYREPHSNWSNHSALEIDLMYDAPTPRRFVFRVHDFDHNNAFDDRFNRNVTLTPGFQTLRFELEEVAVTPSGRPLDLAHIGGFGLFTLDEIEESPSLYLGDMRLVE